MNINTKYFIHTVCVALVLVGLSMPGASAEDVMCRGIVTGVPNFGEDYTGADGVNISIDEIVIDQSGNLTDGDDVTVTWPLTDPPFGNISVAVGDRVEVCGEYRNIIEMPANWSNVGDDWICLTGESDHYVWGLDIRLTGIAIEYIEAEMIGAPEGWNVSVHRVISGQQLCSNRLNVTIQQTFASAGYVDPDIAEGDRVCVYGSYYNDSDGCGVSLSWSQKYYIKKSSQWNAVDAVIALRIAASGESCVEQDVQDMDVSSDGRVTSLDALMILKAALGRIQLR